MIWVKTEAGNFSREGWTGEAKNNPSGKSVREGDSVFTNSKQSRLAFKPGTGVMDSLMCNCTSRPAPSSASRNDEGGALDPSIHASPPRPTLTR
jgi:hypothetical protein